MKINSIPLEQHKNPTIKIDDENHKWKVKIPIKFIGNFASKLSSKKKC